MKVVVNPDGSTTVSCNGASVTINPSSPADPDADSASETGAVSGFIAARRGPSGARLLDAPGASAANRALVLHGQGEMDVDRIRRLLDDAGLRHVAIEITPAARGGSLPGI
jgi:hypothetical protein